MKPQLSGLATGDTVRSLTKQTLRTSEAWVQMRTLTLSSCLSWDKLPTFSVFAFLGDIGDNNFA